MADPVQAILVLVGAVFAVGCCAAGLTFAVAMVCRWLEWSPVNITVNYIDQRTHCDD